MIKMPSKGIGGGDTEARAWSFHPGPLLSPNNQPISVSQFFLCLSTLRMERNFDYIGEVIEGSRLLALICFGINAEVWILSPTDLAFGLIPKSK